MGFGFVSATPCGGAAGLNERGLFASAAPEPDPVGDGTAGSVALTATASLLALPRPRRPLSGKQRRFGNRIPSSGWHRWWYNKEEL